MMTLMPMQDGANDDDGQSMIVQGPLVDKPNEPKRTTKLQIHVEKKVACEGCVFTSTVSLRTPLRFTISHVELVFHFLDTNQFC